ncbi:MAG: energy transducer TonB [Saprospiraceae bacterium]|nr:energy transducer TonB [Saprospiraceae bacterium]
MKFYPLILLLFLSIHSPLSGQNETDGSKAKDQRPAYRVVDVMPRFSGCEYLQGSDREKEECAKSKMHEYIKNNLDYPESAKQKKIEGYVITQFIVTKTGEIADIRITEDLGFQTSEAAKKVLLSMNEMSQLWTPGILRGRNVDVLYTLPIRFNLEQDEIIKNNLNQSGIENVHDTDFEDDREVFTTVQRKALFPTCKDAKCTDKALNKYIQKYLEYPDVSRKSKKKGKVKIEFVISKYGVIRDVAVIRPLGLEYDMEALRVIRSLNQEIGYWQPAKMNGKPVNSRKTIDIEFK